MTRKGSFGYHAKQKSILNNWEREWKTASPVWMILFVNDQLTFVVFKELRLFAWFFPSRYIVLSPSTITTVEAL